MTNFEDVENFHRKFGLLIGETPQHLTRAKLQERIECMQEELNEFKDACNFQDIAGQFDALIDLVYFALGTAVMMGLPWDDGWCAVHNANMSKVKGPTKRGHAQDVTKPPGWKPPNLHKVLIAAGYDISRFAEVAVLDEKCVDDTDRTPRPEPVRNSAGNVGLDND